MRSVESQQNMEVGPSSAAGSKCFTTYESLFHVGHRVVCEESHSCVFLVGLLQGEVQVQSCTAEVQVQYKSTLNQTKYQRQTVDGHR